MTTASFILALRHFVSRQGELNMIWSDNDSNFVGAERVKGSVKNIWSDQNIKSRISKYSMEVYSTSESMDMRCMGSTSKNH